MNKRVASNIIKKYDDSDTRKEALDLAAEHGYTLGIQIEAGSQRLVSVSEGDTVITTQDFEHPVDESTAEPMEQASVKKAPAPKAEAPKK